MNLPSFVSPPAIASSVPRRTPDKRIFAWLGIGLLACLLNTGCVTGRRVVALPVPEVPPTAGQAKAEFAVKDVADARTFENKPGNPATPSVDGDVDALSATEKAKFIGRQRNAYGKAMGDVALPDGDSVPARAKALFEEGLRTRGYRLAANPGDQGIVIKAVVREFWGWSTPGMWSISFEARLKVDLTLTQGGNTHQLTVSGYGKNQAQVASDENWQLAYRRAFLDLLANFAKELDKAGL